MNTSEAPVMHKVQLLEVTPEVMAELAGLDKIEVRLENRLPYGDFAELESVLMFDGRPLRFLQKNDEIYFWDFAEEAGGMLEYAYLTKLDKNSKSRATDYLRAAVGAKNARRAELLRISDRICRRAARKTDISAAKRFIRKGQTGYSLARLQMSEPDAKTDKCKSKIEKAADKVLYHRGEYDTLAAVEQRQPKKEKHDVVRLESSKQVENLYTAKEEISEDSELEILANTALTVGAYESIETAVPEVSPEKTQEPEIIPENHFENKKKSSTIIDTQKLKGEKSNAKSNSEGTSRIRG